MYKNKNAKTSIFWRKNRQKFIECVIIKNNVFLHVEISTNLLSNLSNKFGTKFAIFDNVPQNALIPHKPQKLSHKDMCVIARRIY